MPGNICCLLSPIAARGRMDTVLLLVLLCAGLVLGWSLDADAWHLAACLCRRLLCRELVSSHAFHRRRCVYNKGCCL